MQPDLAYRLHAGDHLRHIKRGTVYTVVGTATLQTDRPLSDNEPVVVYQAPAGWMWARPADEFTTDRFERRPGRYADTADTTMMRVPAYLAETVANLIEINERLAARFWPQPGVTIKAGDAPLVRCASDSDGDCDDPRCPQTRDGEPAASGRHCPLPWRLEEASDDH